MHFEYSFLSEFTTHTHTHIYIYNIIKLIETTYFNSNFSNLIQSVSIVPDKAIALSLLFAKRYHQSLLES